MRKGVVTIAWVACVFALASSAHSEAVQELIAGITDPSPEVRTAAWRNAGPMGAAAIPAVAGQLSATDPEVSRCAMAALGRIAAYAGRPGADEERAAAAAEFGRLLAGPYPADARREIAYLASLVGGAPEVPALVALLGDPELAEDAVMALERIPGPAAGEALAAALDTAAPELQVRLIQALAHRREQGAVDKLMALAGNTGLEKEVRWASYDALTGLGRVPMEIMPMDPAFAPEEKIRYIQGFMRAAQALEDQGEKTKAERIYASVAVFPATPEQASLAILGLARVKSGLLLEHALGYLVEPGIHDAAAQTLKETALPDTDALLVKAYAKSEPIRRAALLPILVARNTPEGMVLVKQAKTDESAEVRMTACGLLGEEVSVEDLEQVMTQGSIWGRGAASRAYIEAAWAQQEAGQPEKAREMFELAAQSPLDPQHKIEALRGVETVASPESLAFVKGIEPAMKSKADPEFAAAAARAWIAVHAALPDKQQAISAILGLIEAKDIPPDLASFAHERLSALGVDAKAIPQSQNAVTEAPTAPAGARPSP